MATVAAGLADHVNGSLAGQNVQHTTASFVFMGIALTFGMVAAVLNRRGRS